MRHKSIILCLLVSFAVGRSAVLLVDAAVDDDTQWQLRPAAYAEKEGIPPTDEDGGKRASSSPSSDRSRALTVAGTTQQFLPAVYDPKLQQYAQSVRSADDITSDMLEDEALIAELAATTFFDNKRDEVVKSIRAVRFGGVDEAVKACQMLSSALKTTGDPDAGLLKVAILIVAREQGGILDERLLGATCGLVGYDYVLARNIGSDGLFSSNGNIQIEAIKRLFDWHIVESANNIHKGAAQNILDLLRAQLVFRLFNNIMSATGEQYKSAQETICVAFAEQLRAEIDPEAKGAPVLTEFLNYCGAIVPDFFLSVTNNIVRASPKDKGLAESSETLVSFVCLQWPKQYIPYIMREYKRVENPAVKASFLYSLGIAVYGSGIVEQQEAAEFLVRESIGLCDIPEARSKVREILMNLPEPLVAHLSEIDERGANEYERLPQAKRKALFGLLVEVGTQNKITEARDRALPFLTYSLAQEDADAGQRRAFFTHFLDETLLARLADTDEKTLQMAVGFVIDDYDALVQQGIISDAVSKRCMSSAGFFAIEKAYKKYRALVSEPEAAGRLLLLCAMAVSSYETDDPNEKRLIGDMIFAVMKGYAVQLRRAVAAFKSNVAHYERLSRMQKELTKQSQIARELSDEISASQEKVAGAKARKAKAIGYLKIKYGQLFTGLEKKPEQELAQTRAEVENIEGQIADLEAERKRAQTYGETEEASSAKIGIANLKERLQGPQRHLQQMEDAFAKAYKAARYTSRDVENEEAQRQREAEFNRVSNKCESIKRQLDEAYFDEDKLKPCEVIFSDTAGAIRLMASGPAVELDIAKDCYRTLINEQTRDLFTALAVALRPDFPDQVRIVSALKQEISRLFRHQSTRGEFRGLLVGEIEILAQLLEKKGFLDPSATEDPLLGEVMRGLEASYLVTATDKPAILESWNRDVNDTRLKFLVGAYTSENVSTGLKASTQRTLHGVCNDWLKNLERWNPTQKFNIDATSVLLALYDLQQASRDQRFKGLSAYHLAVRVLTFDTELAQNRRQVDIVFALLTALRNSLPEKATFTPRGGEPISVVEICDQALRMLAAHKARYERGPVDVTALPPTAPALTFDVVTKALRQHRLTYEASTSGI